MEKPSAPPSALERVSRSTLPILNAQIYVWVFWIRYPDAKGAANSGQQNLLIFTKIHIPPANSRNGSKPRKTEAYKGFLCQSAHERNPPETPGL